VACRVRLDDEGSKFRRKFEKPSPKRGILEIENKESPPRDTFMRHGPAHEREPLPGNDPRTIRTDIPGILDSLFPQLVPGLVASF